MAKSYRKVVEAVLDLTDCEDPIEMAMSLENIAQMLRFAASIIDKEKEQRKLMDAVAPWFDPDQGGIQ